MKDQTATRRLFARIPVKEPSYMHSFSVTNNFVILTEYPFVVNPFEFMLAGQGFIKNFKWKPEKGTTFIVVNKDNGYVVGKYRVDPFFAFHHINAYEVDNEIVVDIITYRDASIINTLADHGIDHPQKDEEKIKGMKIVRYTISLVKGSVSSQVVLEKPIELPTKNDKLDGTTYTYTYAVDIRNPLSKETSREIYKVDVQTGEYKTWTSPGCLPGEAVFVAAPNTKEEDNGVVLSVVLNQKSNTSFLVVLDAQSFKEVARVEIGYPIPAGLHGKHYE
jgi:carotenoid cleavage dioxygenase-like enzyme